MHENPVFSIFKKLSAYPSCRNILDVVYNSVVDIKSDKEIKVISSTEFAFRRFCGMVPKTIKVSRKFKREADLERAIVELLEKQLKK